MADALYVLLTDRVRKREDACDVWAAVPAVMGNCDDRKTYEMHGAALAYAWLHLPERYIRTWLALQRLLEHCLLPMGSEGVRALDVGTGPGPSAFATHDFYAALVRYAEISGNERWRQPAHLMCVECAGGMNGLRHHLAEILHGLGSPRDVLAMCGHLTDFQSIQPSRERKDLESVLRDSCDEYFNDRFDEWESVPRHTPEEANRIANAQHRYRLFTFSNFLTTPPVVERYRSNLEDILADAQPGSVVLVIGGKGGDYPQIYSMIGDLATNAGFSRKAERLSVSCSDAGMNHMVHSERARFYRRLVGLAGDLSDGDPAARRVKEHCEGEHYYEPPDSTIHAHRK
ncbi:MAG: hypothetical protein F4X12_01920 [Acidobacteriia bacterium]|nr:hypothetical protein [Terriglobia bacterium]